MDQSSGVEAQSTNPCGIKKSAVNFFLFEAVIKVENLDCAFNQKAFDQWKKSKDIFIWQQNDLFGTLNLVFNLLQNLFDAP